MLAAMVVPAVGTEWIVDAAGCSPERLRDVERLRALAEGVVRELGLTVVAPPLWHVFPGEGGVTGMLLLAESHLTLHTYPEHRSLALNLYCCNARPTFPFRERLGDLFGASSVAVRTVSRGAGAAS